MIPLLQERLPELCLRLGEHIVLTGTATSLAIVLGLPLGILAARNRIMEKATTGIASILQTIPSLAMLAFLLALLNRIGFAPAIIALTLYALLPIVRGTLTGFQSIPEATKEAALGVGMNPRQRLWLV
ncbi:MAG: ABC transporter permease subunit, partial [Verrucomicrobia bacterium]|nr:ABC transporter permease subunit [Verrucomicrobiota bacterium]